MLNVTRFEEAKEVWRERDGVLERGRRFKLKERQRIGELTVRRDIRLTYWTKADSWTGTSKGLDGEKRYLTGKEAENLAAHFSLVV